MAIDWELVVKVGVPLGALVLGKYLDRWLAKRPKLISYLGHVSSFTVRGENPMNVHTHAIVVRNAGRESANNVRVGHNYLPENYQLNPSVPHTVERIPTGGAEILIPKLVPNEQITISYLYLPPVTWGQINAYTKSDEGFAKVLNVLPTPQPSKLIVAGLWAGFFVGVLTIVYIAASLLLAVVS